MGQSQGKPSVNPGEVTLDQFKLNRVVGRGAFCKVRIVERKDTGLTFALKYIRKDEVVRSENVRNIVRERHMLEHLNHPFLCNLRYSFQDYEYLYLVVDLMTGGDLRFHISRKVFHESAVRFWIAELGCALRYIHKQGVVHRDIKPDNVLLDVEGHVHLTDFNVASDLTANKKLSSKSGTLAYLAPEVYEGKGYRSEVDWWGLGVLFYECIYNKRPFDAHTHDDLSAQIRFAVAKYPKTNPPVESSCVDAIQALLTRDIRNRVGANGFSTFSNLPFFVNGGIDFDLLEKKKIAPIFVPSPFKTNFDATHDLEELLLEEAPLEARAKHNRARVEPKADASQQEKRAWALYQTIEKKFEPFDYTVATFDGVPEAVGEDPLLDADATLTREMLNLSLPPGQSKGLISRTPSTTFSDNRGTSSPPLTTQPSMRALTASTSSGTEGAAGTAPQHPSHGQRHTGAGSRTGSGFTNDAFTNDDSADASEKPEKGKRVKKSLLGLLGKSKDGSGSKKGEAGVIGKGARTIVSE